MRQSHHILPWIILLIVISLVSCTPNKNVVEPQILQPELEQITDQFNTLGDKVELQVKASNPDGTKLNYQAEWLPQGLNINGSSGLISGTFNKVETASVTISVVNEQNERVSTHFIWNVKEAPKDPDPTPLFILSITKQGTGLGNVRSDPAGIDCGTICTNSFEAGFKLQLIATPDEGSSFVGWSGTCTGTDTCEIDLGEDESVIAIFNSQDEPVKNHELTIDKMGSGSGIVISTPKGIECGELCTAKFEEGTEITLNAVPADGSSFSGWSGACSGTGACNLKLSEATTVSALFDSSSLPKYQLSVNKNGTGSGKILSTPSGIDCGDSCSADFTEGTKITLEASASADSTFNGWTGICTGTDTCIITISQVSTVGANFDKLPAKFNLSVSKSGTGLGSVLSTPSGINCGNTCSANFDENTVVTLNANPATGSNFIGWSGACSGNGNCKTTMSQIRNVNAIFDIDPDPLDTSLLAYWKFDNNGQDETEHSNSATLYNASYGRGKFGQSLDLGGKSQQSYAKAKSSSSLNDITDKLTVSAWVYPKVAPDKYHVVVSRQRADLGHPDQFFLGFGPKTPSRGGNGEITYKWHLSTTTNIKGADCYENPPLVNQWIHMVGTYDGSNIRLYINGELICTRAISGNIPVDNNPLTFGVEENDADKKLMSFFNGKIDEVKIYNRSLNLQEIQDLYQEGN